MDSYELKILNDNESNMFRSFVKKYDDIDLDVTIKIPILYIPKGKNIIDNDDYFCDKTVYYLSATSNKNLYLVGGMKLEEFLNNKYKMYKLKCYQLDIDEDTTKIYISLLENFNLSINVNMHTSIMTQLQNTYILLKQMIDFKDINQYIIKMYANIIL